MPELPEVETVKETLKNLILAKTIIKVDLKYPKIVKTDLVEFQKIIGQKFNDIYRRGKYLIFDLDDYYLISHLRMEGKYFIKKDQEIDKHEHIIFYLNNGETLRYHDVRKFGTMELILKKTNYLDFLNKLGPEPFSAEYNAKYLYQKAKKARKTIKDFLLNQSIVAGIGNIYVNEICFLTKIHPLKKVAEISLKQFESIVEETKNVLKRAIVLGGTTIRSYTSSLGVTGRFQNELTVHGKDGSECINCGNIITKIKVSGRGTYLCEKCQK